MNKFLGIGNVTRDVDVRHINDGTTVARFSLALNRPKKDAGADYINCVAFGKTAELIEKYVSKGNKIGIEARVQTGSYDGKNGKVYTTGFVVDQVEFLTSKSDGVQISPEVEKQMDDFMNVEETNEGFLPFN